MARRHESNWVRVFEVSNPTKHKKGFTVYKVVSKVYLKTYPEAVTTLKVWKRYNDFKKLYKELQAIHRDLHLGGEFPKFPKPKVFGLDRFDYDIVEERRKCAYHLLEFAAKYSQLFTSKIFVQFFEHGYQIKDSSVPGGEDQADNVSKTEGEVLVPERIWKENKQSPNEETVSVSSVGSSAAETATVTDSDSIMSSSIMSSSMMSSSMISADVPTSLPTAHTVDFGSLSFLSSMQSSQVPSETDDKRSDTTTTTALTVKPSILKKRSKVEIQDGCGGDLNSSAEIRRETRAEGRSNTSNLFLVSSSKSCPSLDAISSSSCGDGGTLPPQEASKLKRKNFKPSWSLSIRRKPNGIAGFFDFLPIFPKMTLEKKLSEEKLFSDSLSSSYVCEAAGHFSIAQENESNGDYQNALESYKEGIRILLAGGQNDKDTKRRLIVRNKVEKYLSKAEQLHSSLSKGKRSDTALFSPKKIQKFLNPGEASELAKAGDEIMKPSPLEDLKDYKVVGIADAGVLIVINIGDKSGTGSKCFCVKVLRKSVDPLIPSRRTVIANRVPFMVKLVKWFDTENTIILLLQYAGGGKLENFVSSYQSKAIAIIPHEINPDEYTASDTFEDRASSQCSSTDEREKISAEVLASTFAEQLENNSCDLNGNLEGKEELCESYARLFQESDTDDCVCQGRGNGGCCSRNSQNADIAGNSEAGGEHSLQVVDAGRTRGLLCRQRNVVEIDGTSIISSNSHERNGREVLENNGKLTLDSSGRGIISANEALESEWKVNSLEANKRNGIQETGKKEQQNSLEKRETSNGKGTNTATTTTNVLVDNNSMISWANLDTVETGDLIESSKVLIQTVSRTLNQYDGPPIDNPVNEGGSNLKEMLPTSSGSNNTHATTAAKWKENCGKHPEVEEEASSSRECYSDCKSSSKNNSNSYGIAATTTAASTTSGVSTTKRAMPALIYEPSVIADCTPTSSTTIAKPAVSSLLKRGPRPQSLSKGEQKGATNETENNNSHRRNSEAWSQNGSDLMNSEIVSESSSQFIKLGRSNSSQNVAKEERDHGEIEKDMRRASPSSHESLHPSSQELLLLEEKELNKSREEEERREDGEETKLLLSLQNEASSSSRRSSSSSKIPSHCLQPSPSKTCESSANLSPSDPLPIQRMVPECCVKVWMAEMVLSLEKLHALGLTYGDLGMRNILLGENGHILLSFTSQWAEVDHIPKCSDWVAPEARHCLENSGEEKIHFCADWWSLGAILFYLLTGKSVQSCHPEGFHANTVLRILDKNLMDEDISQHAKSLMTELLQINPNLRLGYYGAEEIKSHPFFDGFDWNAALNDLTVGSGS